MIDNISSPNSPAFGILRLVCGYVPDIWARKIMVVLNGYMDESGNDGKSAFLILGGYVLPADKWMAFSLQWNKTLNAAPPIKYFKSVEAEYGDGEFSNIARREFRQMKIRDLIAVIKQHECLGLLTWMALDDWRTLLLPYAKTDFRNPYYPLCDWVIKEVFKYQLSHGIFECSTDFIFDDQSDKNLKANLVLVHEAIRDAVKDNSNMYQMLGSSPTFRDDKTVLPLQAADLLVWHKRRQLNYPKEQRKIYTALDDTTHFSKHLDAVYLNQLGTKEIMVSPDYRCNSNESYRTSDDDKNNDT